MKRWNIKDQNNKRHGLVINADCVLALQGMETNSVDSIVTDPPYEIGFMGKGHDSTGITYDVEMWKECLRVLKPGGHLLSFGATKTYHRMACAVEDAGFEIRDAIFWCYGSGFPKSQNIGKAIDKAAGALAHESQRFIVAGQTGKLINPPTKGYVPPAPATPEAQQWQGWGTALKPAVEPIVVARKPLSEKTVAKNVLKHGTGALNVDGCRVDMGAEYDPTKTQRQQTATESTGGAFGAAALVGSEIPTYSPKGRWPANLILGHGEGCERVGVSEDEFSRNTTEEWTGFGQKEKPDYESEKVVTSREVWTCVEGCPVDDLDKQGDGTSRFFHTFQMESPLIYQAKANKKERPTVDGTGHSTVKPLTLMRNLVRLVTPPDGIVLDPFGGSGTTGEAALLEGFNTILIEQDPDYCKLIEVRLNRNQYVMVKRVVLKSRKPKRRIVRRQTR